MQKAVIVSPTNTACVLIAQQILIETWASKSRTKEATWAEGCFGHVSTYEGGLKGFGEGIFWLLNYLSGIHSQSLSLSFIFFLKKKEGYLKSVLPRPFNSENSSVLVNVGLSFPCKWKVLVGGVKRRALGSAPLLSLIFLWYFPPRKGNSAPFPCLMLKGIPRASLDHSQRISLERNEEEPHCVNKNTTSMVFNKLTSYSFCDQEQVLQIL